MWYYLAWCCRRCRANDSHFPHVAVPEPCGIPPSVLLGICRALVEAYGRERIVGLSVTEFAPQPTARPQQIAAGCALVSRVVEELFDISVTS